MVSFFRKFKSWNLPKKIPGVTFATSVWEQDWEKILCHPTYLKEMQIARHCFSFEKKILVINNVKDPAKVVKVAEERKKEGILTDVIVAKDYESSLLSFFQLERKDFRKGVDAHLYPNVTDDWVFYNATGPLAAIYFCQTPYLLYMTGDSHLKEPVQWIEKAITLMERNPKYKVSNLTWNNDYQGAKKESFRKKKDFFVAKEGFSDQCFLVRMSDFQRPIYQEIRKDAHHFPRGDVFEKRVFSFLKNRGYQRLIYRYGSYTHENII